MERNGSPSIGRKVRIGLAAAGTAAWSLAAGACGGNGGLGPETPAATESAAVRLLLTDAPSDMLDSAHVWISRVFLTGGGGTVPDTSQADTTDAGTGKLDLFNDPANPLRVDLLQLRGGATADVTGFVLVDATTYQGARFVIDSARVTLAEGFTFEDGSRVGSMKVPSGMRSGVKVKLSDVLHTTAGDTLTVTVDFDVDENFTIQTNQGTGTVRRILFRPVLREERRQAS